MSKLSALEGLATRLSAIVKLLRCHPPGMLGKFKKKKSYFHKHDIQLSDYNF